MIVEEDFALHHNHESIIQQLAVEHDLLGNLCKLNVEEYDHCNV